MSGPETTETVLATVAGLVREVIDEDWANEVVITLDTAFAKDLELESIEFVALAERLREVYGPRVDLARWLGEMELEAIIGLEVGTLVEYIVRCLSQHTTA
jgi:acyl carrier protein